MEPKIFLVKLGRLISFVLGKLGKLGRLISFVLGKLGRLTSFEKIVTLKIAQKNAYISIIWWLGNLAIVRLFYIYFYLTATSKTVPWAPVYAKAETIVEYEAILCGIIAFAAAMLIWRVFCELPIIVYRHNETLTDIHKVQTGPKSPNTSR